MHIDTLSLMNFRNIEHTKINLTKDINIFYGKNAAGKTNILESIYFAATSRSLRANMDKELIKFGEKEAHIQTIVKKDTMTNKIDVHLKKDGRKGIAVNGIAIKKLHELYGTLHVVIFSPEDLKLLKSSPVERRRFIDMELCQLSNIYYYNLQQYYKVLKERNNLLKTLQKDKSLQETLFIWDTQLVEYGIKIIEKRREYIDRLNLIAHDKHLKITDGKERLSIIYQAETDESRFKEKLKKSIYKDILSGSTSVGPHRDDILFEINGDHAKTYGSQGQQRTAALSLKLSELDIIKEEKMTEPVLLLDDVLSELDTTRQRCLIENIASVQRIITCTGLDHILDIYGSQGKVFLVEDGVVRKE